MFFKFWEKNFQNFHNFSARILSQFSKLRFTCTDDHLMKNWICTEKCNKFFVNQVLKQKVCQIFGRKVTVRLSELHLLVARIILEKRRNSWKKIIAFHNFGLRAESYLNVADLLLQCWQNCNFPRQSTFLIVFSHCNFFHPFRNLSLKIPHFQSKCLGTNVKTEIQLYKRKFDGKPPFPLKSVTVSFINFGLQSKKCVEHLVEKSSKAVRAALCLCRESFWKQSKFSWATWFFFIFLWLRAEKNLTSDFFSTLLTKICVLRLQSKNLNFFRTFFNFFKKLRDLRMNFSHS